MNVRCLLLLLWIVPAAFLSGCATGQVVRDFRDQYFEISAKVDEAEMLGARTCSPRELANARIKLAEAFHEASEPHYPRTWVQAEFDKANIAAENLLSTGRLRAGQDACR